jgi:hypothetical protein
MGKLGTYHNFPRKILSKREIARGKLGYVPNFRSPELT